MRLVAIKKLVGIFRRRKRKCVDFAEAKSKGVTFLEWEKDCDLGLRRHSLIILLFLFASIVFATFLLIVLSGIGVLYLSDEFMVWLVRAIWGELTVLTAVILKKLWDI